MPSEMTTPLDEVIEAMAAAAYHEWFGDHAVPKWGEAVISKEKWRSAARKSLSALLACPHLGISYECRQTLRSHLEANDENAV